MALLVMSWKHSAINSRTPESYYEDNSPLRKGKIVESCGNRFKVACDVTTHLKPDAANVDVENLV